VRSETTPVINSQLKAYKSDLAGKMKLKHPGFYTLYAEHAVPLYIGRKALEVPSFKVSQESENGSAGDSVRSNSRRYVWVSAGNLPGPD
jgi:hypothetical protein